MATDRYGKYTCMSLTVCIRALHPHFGKAEVADRHCGLASYVSTFCSYTLQSYILSILCLIIRKFSLRISMNYTENVAELLAHARTVDTRCSSLIFSSA